MGVTTIAAKQAAWVAKALLMTAKTFDIYGAAGEPPIPNKISLPAHNSTSVLFRRYENLPTTPKALAEGITPEAANLTKTDITVPLTQFGDYVILGDITVDTVEDPLLSITGERQGEQAVYWLNQIRLGRIIAGVNVAYSNGAARNAVNTLISASFIDKAARTLNLNKARKITKVLAATQGYNTMPIPATYVGFCSTYTCYDLKNTITEANGFTPAHKYANMKLIRDNEYGAVGLVRFIEDPDMTYFADAGGAKGSGHKSTGGTYEDVFASLIVGQEAYGILQFGGYSGTDGIKTYVETSGGTADPLHQRNTVGWKTMQGAAITNDNWMVRLEHGVTG